MKRLSTHTRRWWLLAAGFGVLALAVGGALVWWLAANNAGPAAQAAGSELKLLQARDFASHYRSLTPSDRAKVTEAEWIARCREEASVLGTITAFQILSTTPLESPQGSVAVRVRLTYSNLKTPLDTQLYYVKDGTVMRPTMMWGETLTK